MSRYWIKRILKFISLLDIFLSHCFFYQLSNLSPKLLLDRKQSADLQNKAIEWLLNDAYIG